MVIFSSCTIAGNVSSNFYCYSGGAGCLGEDVGLGEDFANVEYGLRFKAGEIDARVCGAFVFGDAVSIAFCMFAIT